MMTVSSRRLIFVCSYSLSSRLWSLLNHVLPLSLFGVALLPLFLSWNHLIGYIFHVVGIVLRFFFRCRTSASISFWNRALSLCAEYSQGSVSKSEVKRKACISLFFYSRHSSYVIGASTMLQENIFQKSVFGNVENELDFPKEYRRFAFKFA